jgi:hypothetical protein
VHLEDLVLHEAGADPRTDHRPRRAALPSAHHDPTACLGPQPRRPAHPPASFGYYDDNSGADGKVSARDEGDGASADETDTPVSSPKSMRSLPVPTPRLKTRNAPAVPALAVATLTPRRSSSILSGTKRRGSRSGATSFGRC